jgi:hypothetical protein
MDLVTPMQKGDNRSIIFAKLFFVQNSSGLADLTGSPAQDDSPASGL